MNHRCAGRALDDARQYDRGKIMTAEMLEEAATSAAISTSTATASLPHLSRHASDQGLLLHPRHLARPLCALFRGRSGLSDNMQRLVRKFETAQDMVPRPLQANAAKLTKYGVIYFGSTSPAMDEAIGLLEARGHHLDRLRIRAFPFHSSVASFIADHDSSM